jgi:uncharacterized membrane protein
MWLLGAGIAMALLAAVLGFTDFLGDPRVRSLRDAWMHMIGNLVVVILQAVNFYIRAASAARDTVTPAGVTLSAVVVAILLFTGWKGWELVYRHHVGVTDEPSPDVTETLAERSMR